MHVPGTSPLAGDHRGRDGVAAVFRKEMSLLDAPPEFEDHDDLGSDRHAVKLVTQRLRRGGRMFEGRQTMVAHVRDGKFSEVWFQPETRQPLMPSSPRLPLRGVHARTGQVRARGAGAAAERRPAAATTLPSNRRAPPTRR